MKSESESVTATLSAYSLSREARVGVLATPSDLWIESRWSDFLYTASGGPSSATSSCCVVWLR